MGDYDIVRLFMSQNGKLLLAKLHMGPGASFAFGLIYSPVKQAQIPFFGLAGPPGGCLNNFELLVRPALLKMMGFTALEHPAVEAMADDTGMNDRPVDFIRWVKLYRSEGTYRVRFNSPNGMGMFGNMTTSNAMVIIPEGRLIQKGDRVTALPLDWCRDYAIQ